VRIRASADDRGVLGSGVLLGDRTVLTCAHVLPAEGRVLVDFPELKGAESRWATVRDAFPAREDEPYRADVALLALLRPVTGGVPAPLVYAAPLIGAPVEMCGYPASVRGGAGLALPATLSRKFGERVQLTLADGAHLPRHGCSGGPVLDLRTPSRILGITVTGTRVAQGPAPLHLAHMIPVDTIVKYLPEVRGWATGQHGVEPGIVSADSAAQLLDPDYARRLASWLRGDDDAPVYVTEAVEGGARDLTLRRALALADRELSPGSPETVSHHPEATVPPVGSLDFARDVRKATADKVAALIAERLNVTGPDPPRPRAWLLREPMSPTVALLAVNRSAVPRDLLAFCGDLAERGFRLLLVFRDAGTRPAQDVCDGLALRHRFGRLTGHLTSLGDRARVLDDAAARLAGVRPQGEVVVGLWEALAAIRLAHTSGAGPAPDAVAAALRRLQRRVREADTALRCEETRAGELFARRREMRERFATYEFRLTRDERVEEADREVAGEYAEARRALYGPFDPAVAGAALERFVDAVRRVLDWPPTEPAEPAEGERDGPEAGERDAEEPGEEGDGKP
jgi:hypothetical protein